MHQKRVSEREKERKRETSVCHVLCFEKRTNLSSESYSNQIGGTANENSVI